HSQRTGERRRGVLLLADQQNRRGLAPVVRGRRARLGGPAPARRVVPGGGPGQERGQGVDAPAALAPRLPVLRPRRVGALHRQVDGVVVVVPHPTDRVVLLLQQRPVLVVHPRGERRRDGVPVVLAVSRGQEQVDQLGRPDLAACR